MKYKLWYLDDEVKCYHPVVEEILNLAIHKLGKSEELEVKHHPEIPGLTTVPDFGIRIRGSGRYIFVIEVKKTRREVYSQRYWNQARSYIHDLSHYWEPGRSKFFCVTNIEEIIFFADRDGPINSCILSGNYKHTSFDKYTKSADSAANEFFESITKILSLILKKEPPNWIDDWSPLINSFESNYSTLIRKLGKDDYMARDATLYEFLRLLFYVYLKEYYALEKNPNNSYFKNLIFSSFDKKNYINSIQNYFANVLKLDFKQIFSDFPDSKNRIFPDKVTNDLIKNFMDFILLLNRHIESAIKQNSSPEYLFNLLTSKIYEREELHNKGKIMTDTELAGFLANITIENESSEILDPGSGDGALLDAAYDVLMSKVSEKVKVDNLHQHILNHLHGIEQDPFLAQLSAFRLLSKNFNAISKDTFVDIVIGDIFNNPNKEKYDVVLMNPPFLRNDDEKAPIINKDLMIDAIKKQDITPFVEEAQQPNLYFYFINYIWHYLKVDGKAGIILMAKFLNSKNGSYLKSFIKDKVESIITYPHTYFKEFKVTTVILILSKKKESQKKVSFLRIINPKLIENHQFIKKELNQSSDKVMSDYTLKQVERDELNPQDNWRLFFIDPKDKFNKFQRLSLLVDLKNKFKILTRGQADTSGGSKIVYFNSTANPLIKYTQLIEPEFKTFGLQNNKLTHGRRKFILTDDSLREQNAIYLDSKLDALKYSGITAYLNEAMSLYKENWVKIAQNVKRSTVVPSIIIPRADREKHSIYLNTENKKIVISTNFFYLDQYNNQISEINESKQLKFIGAYLLSSFGQLQFEIGGNNQEGLRKLEGFIIDKFRIIDPKNVNPHDIDRVVNEFERLNEGDIDFSGLEGTSSVRRSLDMAVGKIIYEAENFGFSSLDEFVDDFELFLLDLVDARKN